MQPLRDHGDSISNLGSLSFRAITTADIPQLARSVADAFARYRDFAPDGWQPPTAGSETARLERSVAGPGFWGEGAFEQETLVGHAAFTPAATHSFRPELDANSAHLLHLFVSPEHWGSGLATRLLADSCTAATARGHAAMRLFVAEGQSRARRFYEREGFTSVGEPFEFGLGLPALEYRRERCAGSR